MNDHIKEEIPLYLAGGLTESRNRQIEAHAAACEKCRAALAKARSKQARGKREALKKAAPDRVPNFFLARQGKGVSQPSTHGSPYKVVFVLLLLVGAGYWGYNRWFKSVEVSESEPVPADEAPADVPAQEPQMPEPKELLQLPVLKSWKGPESAIIEPRVVVARRPEVFEKLWIEMQATEPRPQVDFGTSVVLAIFAGASPLGTTIELGRIEGTDEIYAPYRIVRPPSLMPGTTSPAPTSGVSHPYFIAAVVKTDRKIKLSRREAR